MATGKRKQKVKKSKKWKTLQHNGIIFPPEYDVRGFTIMIKGETVSLAPNQEEMAYQWAKKKDTPYVQDKVFQKNFTEDFLETFGSQFKRTSYHDIDFSDVYDIVDAEKKSKEEEKEQAKLRRLRVRDEKKRLRLEIKAMEKSGKSRDQSASLDALYKEIEALDAQVKSATAKKKALKEEIKAKYGFAVVDGESVEVGNYMAEPPGIFIGRGDHPLRGRWKPRITPKDVILNLDRTAARPPGDWGKIVHNHEATWLASWVDFLTGKTKYVWLADTAGLKQGKDREKYEKAKDLARSIDKIQKRIISDMKSRDPKKRKISTVCYLIYRTAMRVGDEKDPEEADTVGATTLRKEHIKITDDEIKFDFLGKDSIRWQETIAATGDDKQFRDNLKKIMKKKRPKDEIFDSITSRHVNQYYSGILKGLSAKVFRTYLATTKVKEYLLKHDDISDETENKKIYYGKLANLEAAKMCNHKRTIPKTFQQSLEKKKERLETLNDEKPWKRLEGLLKKKKASQAKTSKQKTSKTKRIKALKEQIKGQQARHAERRERLQLQIKLADATKDYNIGTSLRNYIDPRVFKTWTREVGLEWGKLYTPALQKKFTWVAGEDVDWQTFKPN